MTRTVRYFGWEKDCSANGCPTPCRHLVVIGNWCPIHRRRDVNGRDGFVARRQVIDPKTLQLVDDHRIPIAGSRQRCGVWVTIGNQRSNR